MSAITSIPDRYICPISTRTMGDPVAVHHAGDTGAERVAHIFSRAALEDWMREQPVCPLDRRTIVGLVPQPALRHEIRAFVAARPELFGGRSPEEEIDAPLRRVHEEQRQEILGERDRAGGVLARAESAERELLRYTSVLGSPAHRTQILARRVEQRPGVPSREFAGAPLDHAYRRGHRTAGRGGSITFHVRDPYYVHKTRIQLFPLRVTQMREREGGIQRGVVLHRIAPDRSGFVPLSEDPSLLLARTPLAPARIVTVALHAGDAGISMSLSAFRAVCAATTILLGAACAFAAQRFR